MVKLIGPALVLYLFVTAYLDRRRVLGSRGNRQLARRVAEISVGIAVVIFFGKALDRPEVRAGAPGVQLAILTPAVYGVALSATGLLHVVHLLFDKPQTPYKVGWLLLWIATASLALIVIVPLIFPYGIHA